LKITYLTHRLYNIISGRQRVDGTIDTSVMPFSKLTIENQMWWGEKAKLLAEKKPKQ
jgi:hypothetical protein